MPGIWNPRTIRGETVRLGAQLTGPDGSPINLTGCTVAVRPGGASGHLSASITNAAQGRLLLEVRGLQVGRHPYELVISWPDGQQWVLLMGYVVVEEGPYAEP